MHDLTFMATGIFGEPLPKQNGAPLRLVVPWKYGYKSIKSIVKIEFTNRQPKTLWNALAPREYPFESNVDPGVPHPRWSQASERLGWPNPVRVKTNKYNGYPWVTQLASTNNSCRFRFFRSAQVRDWEERTWNAGIAVESVIEQAGQAVASLATQVTQSEDFILLLAGKGKNGSDTRIAAAHLSDREVKVLDITNPAEDVVLHQLISRGSRTSCGRLVWDWVESGLGRALAKVYPMHQRIGCLVLSVDCPSGLDADNGLIREQLIEAAITLCLGGLKSGLLVNSAAQYGSIAHRFAYWPERSRARDGLLLGRRTGYARLTCLKGIPLPTKVITVMLES